MSCLVPTQLDGMIIQRIGKNFAMGTGIPPVQGEFIMQAVFIPADKISNNPMLLQRVIGFLLFKINSQSPY